MGFADVLVMESTYGNRVHPRNDVRPELAKVIRQTAERGGSMVVPAFAVERTQKFVFMLKELMETGQIPRLPVYCDSPMAIKAVEIYLKHESEYTDEARTLIQKYGSPLEWPGFTFASTADESKKINDSACTRRSLFRRAGWLRAGGFCIIWRIRLPDPKNMMIFIGFQAPGTRGAIDQERGEGSEDLRRFRADSRADRGV